MKNRSRRLRKKLHVGEFTQLGFTLQIKLREGLSVLEHHAFWDAFILEAIESNLLSFGGGQEGFVYPEGRVSGTEQHRELVRAWLAERREVTTFTVGPLIDIYAPVELFPCLP